VFEVTLHVVLLVIKHVFRFISTYSSKLIDGEVELAVLIRPLLGVELPDESDSVEPTSHVLHAAHVVFFQGFSPSNWLSESEAL